MPNNMLFFINFESLGLYWTYFLALQTTTPKISPMRLMSLDHEPKMRWCAMSWTMGFDVFLCKYGLFWALKEVFPKSMIMLTWCRSPMKWSHVVWKICPRQYLFTIWELKIICVVKWFAIIDKVVFKMGKWNIF